LRLRAGFTMIELFVVLTMLAILSAMSMGRVGRLIKQQRLYRASMAIQNDLEAAFSLSVRNRTAIQIVWDEPSMELRVQDSSTPAIVFRHTNLGPDAYGLRAGMISFCASPPLGGGVCDASVTVFPNGLADKQLTFKITIQGGADPMHKTIQMRRGGLIYQGET
jgi:prepilin-type N-terminal cleavage/methylation domain-containing protein